MKTKHIKGKLSIIKMNYQNKPKEIIIGIGISEKINNGIYSNILFNTIIPETDKEYIKQHNQIKADCKHIIKCWNMHDEMLEALTEISKGEGAYDMDKLKHASNTIENIKSIANNIIEKVKNHD